MGKSNIHKLYEAVEADSSARYISPENKQEFIKSYDQSVRDNITLNTGSWEKNKERKLWDKLRGKNKQKFVANKAKADQIYNNPEFQKEHKEVLDYMAKQPGFTLRVG